MTESACSWRFVAGVRAGGHARPGGRPDGRRRDRHRDQDRQHQPLQRPGLGLRHDRQGASAPTSRRSTTRAASTGGRSTTSATTTATARPRRWRWCASWSSRTRWPSLFQTLGTPTNTAIHKYVNQQKVPHLFVATGATKWNDPKNFPWTMGYQPNYQTEGRVYAAYILKNFPDAKIGILYQNDDYGKDYLKGFEDGLGEAAKKLIVMKQSLRGDRSHDRLADRQPEEQRRQRLLQHHDPEVRRAGDQEGARHRLEAGALPEQRVELARPPCSSRPGSRPPRASSPRST